MTTRTAFKILGRPESHSPGKVEYAGRLLDRHSRRRFNKKLPNGLTLIEMIRSIPVTKRIESFVAKGNLAFAFKMLMVSDEKTW